MATHDMSEGSVQRYRRPESRVWQCAARVGGKRYREPTREEDRARAKDVAEARHLDPRGTPKAREDYPAGPKDQREAGEQEAGEQEAGEQEAAKQEAAKQEAAKQEAAKQVVSQFEGGGH